MAEDPTREPAEHRDAVYRYVRGILREPGAAEDLTQETLLKAQAKLGSLEDPAKMLPWLYRIATNLCRDWFRSASHRNPALSLDRPPRDAGAAPWAEKIEDTAPRLDDLLERKEMSACVQQYIADLPDTYRAAILLHDAEGLTNPEIAELLGVSLPTVKIRLHRARNRLREALDRACSFSTDHRGVLVCEPKPDGEESEPSS